MRTTWEQFRGAALLLAGPGAIKQRLASAFRLHLAAVDVERLPRELRAEFLSLAQAMSCERPIGGLGAIEASVRKMSDLQAAKFAERVVEMFGALSQLQPAAMHAPPLRAIGSAQA